MLKPCASFFGDDFMAVPMRIRAKGRDMMYQIDNAAILATTDSSMPAASERAFQTLERLIGNTPLIGVNLVHDGQAMQIYAKLEYFNLSGSIKDRMALEVLRCAYKTGALRPGDLIVNPLKGKKLSNVRASGKDEAVVLTTPINLTLEYALEFINDDELVEVTPESIRIRKRFLLEHERKKESRKAEALDNV